MTNLHELDQRVDALAAGGAELAKALAEADRRISLLEDTVAHLGGTVVGIVETAVAAKSLETSRLSAAAKKADL